MLTVGLTGDVGAGKSTLSKVWEEMGAAVIDADRVARDMWQLPDVQKMASERWGSDFFEDDQKSVFAKIAEKIFSDFSWGLTYFLKLHIIIVQGGQRRVSAKALKHNSVPECLVMQSFQ